MTSVVVPLIVAILLAILAIAGVYCWKYRRVFDLKRGITNAHCNEVVYHSSTGKQSCLLNSRRHKGWSN